jgi:trimeric autotransporter adhesin
MSLSKYSRLWCGLAFAAAGVVGASAGAPAQQAGAPPQSPPGQFCRVEGHVTSGRDALPGVSVVVHDGGEGNVLKAATSTDIDGKFTVLFAPNATYRLTAELTAFGSAERTLTLGAPPCDTAADFQLALRPRREALAASGDRARPATPVPGQTGTTAASSGGSESAATGAAAPSAPGRGGRGNGGRAGQGGRGFQTLEVQADANGEATLGSTPQDDAADAARLLPAGFSLQTAQAEAVAISGSNDATNLDRGLLNDRTQAIALGQFDPATGQFAQGFGPQAGQAFGGDLGGPGAAGQFGGRGGGPGGGGRGGFFLGGRAARGQSPYQGTATYTFGGSALNTAPYQINPTVPATQPRFAQNTFGTTFGGPLKIPGLYKDTNRRTNFQVNYTGNRSNNVFDQYATVPTLAERSGDFSGTGFQPINPQTGQPFAAGLIPAPQLIAASQYLLGFIPPPNLPGDQLNYHTSTLANSSSDSLSLRFTQNLSPTVPPIGGPGGGRGGGFGGGRGGFGGRGGQGNRGTNIVLQGQLQYRRNESEALNVFPGLGSTYTNSSITVPISLNVVHNRTVNNFSVNITHAESETTNAFANVQNVGGLAGINYPTTASADPQNWGVPRLNFTGFTGVSGAPATSRTDTRITTGYFWSHSYTKNQLRIGGDYRLDRTSSQLNTNAPGAFTFTGLYSAGGIPLSGTNGSNAAFADFLLGLPQQAAIQVGGVTQLRGRSFDAYLEDNWQKSPKLTFNLGLRYELVMPYTDANGRLANLDAAPGFVAVAPVLAGATGPFTGGFPAGLINTDTNNIGPRIGFAYRPVRGTVVRGGYSITYNPGSYANIGRRLAAQPPAAVTETIVGGPATPLNFEDALLSTSASTTNNWGVDKDYQLGLIQTWNATLSKDLTQSWNVLIGYTGVKGLDLDLLSAPNRGPGGTLLIPDVQPFTWEESQAHSILNLGNFQITRRLAHGLAGIASYTLSKSMDDTPSLGSGSTIVAQDPRDLSAEWAPSNFDRRQQFTANLVAELPFGAGRRWLDNGGLLSAVVGGWTATAVFTAQSGTPFTARVCGAATDIAQGTNCATRANVTGLPVQITDPTVTAFFNKDAFAPPVPGTFGDAARNMIYGPGGHQLNGTLVRDIRLNGNRAVTLQVNATNLLNTVQWTFIDTDFNSQTFGHVVSVKPMRAATMSLRFRF